MYQNFFKYSFFSDAWKACINLHSDAHERLKRSQFEPTPVKQKKQRTLPPLEDIPNQIMCKVKPDPDKVPVIMLSCIDKDNEEKVKQAVQ